ncbi:MAG: glycoside hydrolase family 1 protein [Oscillospiraceae bacterium]|nr:glycoside hydrolase family 1 protein [Oscillospiraceae bacterium]
MSGFMLTENLLLGVSSAATSIEGGALQTSWAAWRRHGQFDGDDGTVGAGHRDHWGEDIFLMRRMGIQTYRFGLEWARIEPQEGIFDEDAFTHYRAEIRSMKDAGIRPLLTFQRFTNPLWFERLGGFERAENLDFFLRFVRRSVEALGDLVSEYITFDSPNLYARCAYFDGFWSPGVRNASRMYTVLTNLASCHVRAYESIHKARRAMGFDDTKVSIAVHMHAYRPLVRGNPLHRALSAAAEFAAQGAFLQAALLGRSIPPLKYDPFLRPGIYCDFHAVNYGGRTTVAAAQREAERETYTDEMGQDIAPLCLIRCCRTLYDLAQLPIYVTECGVCSSEDPLRAHFIYEHLRRICECELPIERFYYRSFCDGAECLAGNSARYGLVHIDFETMARSIKPSGDFYSEIIRARGVSEELYARFCAAPAAVQESF